MRKAYQKRVNFGSLGRLIDWNSIFEPESILPGQIYETSRGIEDCGEKRLMGAIFRDALKCYEKYAFSSTNDGKRIFGGVDGWINNKNSEWVYSFENICGKLGFDSDYVRRVLNNWKREKIRKREYDPRDYDLELFNQRRCSSSERL